MSLIEIGKKIKFKNFVDLSKEEALQVLEYRNLPEVRKNMLTQEIIREDDHLTFIQYLKCEKTKLYYGVEYDGEIIGAVYLTDINTKDKLASWGIYIGKHKFVGIGAVVAYAFVEFVFNDLMFECIHSEVFHFNKSAIQLNKTFGFVITNKNDDLVFMSLDKLTWISQYKMRILNLIKRLD